MAETPAFGGTVHAPAATASGPTPAAVSPEAEYMPIDRAAPAVHDAAADDPAAPPAADAEFGERQPAAVTPGGAAVAAGLVASAHAAAAAENDHTVGNSETARRTGRRE